MYLHFKSANHTFIILVPKTTTTSDVSDFRFISYVNLIYKLLTKIMADRISMVSSELISPNQTAFIESRLISNNTILIDVWLWEEENL